MAQGYNQEEDIDYEETFAPVARLEAIRLLLVFACYMDFKLYQMYIKSVFLNGSIKKKSMLNNPPDLKTMNIPTMSSN